MPRVESEFVRSEERHPEVTTPGSAHAQATCQRSRWRERCGWLGDVISLASCDRGGAGASLRLSPVDDRVKMVGPRTVVARVALQDGDVAAEAAEVVRAGGGHR